MAAEVLNRPRGSDDRIGKRHHEPHCAAPREAVNVIVYRRCGCPRPPPEVNAREEHAVWDWGCHSPEHGCGRRR